MNNQFVTNQILIHENIAILILSGTVLLVPAVAYLKNGSRNESSRILTFDLFVSICAVFAYAFSFIHHPEPHDVVFLIFTAAAYIGFYAAIFLYFSMVTSYLNAKRKRQLRPTLLIIVLVVSSICALLWFLSLFGDNSLLPELSDGRYDLLFWIGHSAEIILLITALYYIIYHRRILTAREVIGLLSVPVLLLAATLAEPLAGGLTIRYPALMLGLTTACTQLFGGGSPERRYSSSGEMNPRTVLALGRIKPHYVGNVLSTIYYLCEMSPTQAQSIIGAFSDYLRSVLETINNDGLVPFTYEMNIIRNYLTLEKKRFEDNLRIDYDIDITDFKVPPLSIQTLVERAVKQGIAVMDRPGTVHIETRHLAGNMVQIRIIDDGVGFDAANIKADPEYKELRLLHDRIKEDAGGNLTIESSPEHGTTAVVALPLDRN